VDRRKKRIRTKSTTKKKRKRKKNRITTQQNPSEENYKATKMGNEKDTTRPINSSIEIH